MQSVFETVQNPQMFSWSKATNTLSQSVNSLRSIRWANELPALQEQFEA